MKPAKAILVFILCFSMATTYCIVSASEPIGEEKKAIIDRWVSESNPDWELTFVSDGKKCLQTLQGSLIRTSLFEKSNTSPQCSEVVPVDESTSYLKLTNVAVPGD